MADASGGPSLEEKVNAWASIKKDTFVVTMGVFFAIAMISVLARAMIRLRTWRRLDLDDYLLFIGAAVLIASTVLLYNLVDQLYVYGAVQMDVSIVFDINSQQLQDMIDNSAAQTITVIVLLWTAMFAVKLSFLAFFKQLVSNVDKVQYYYWSVVVFTVVTWMFLVGEAFILCPYFGSESIKCFDRSRDLLNVSLTGFVTGLDCLSDIMIVSIPIIILTRANLKLSQKLTLGAFLCLSLFMVVLAITRVSKIHGAYGVDLSWVFFWLFMESVVAVIMGSLTAFRTLFIGHNLRRRREEEKPKSWVTNTFLRMRYRKKQSGSGNGGYGDLEGQDGGLPRIPGATMTGMRTFLRRNNRTGVGLTTNDASTVALSQIDTLAEVEGAYYKQQEHPNSKGAAQVHVQRGWGIQGEYRPSPSLDNMNNLRAVPPQWASAPSETITDTTGTYTVSSFGAATTDRYSGPAPHGSF